MRLPRMTTLVLTRQILKLSPGANDTANPPTITCSIEQICAFGGFNGKAPDQAFRYLSSARRNLVWIPDNLFLMPNLDLSLRFSYMLVSSISFLICSHKIRLLHKYVSIFRWAVCFDRPSSCLQIEREMGSAGFIITYMAAGIFGYVGSFRYNPSMGLMGRQQSNVLGGNFARPGIPSLGASGAIFGMFAVSNPFDLNPPLIR